MNNATTALNTRQPLQPGMINNPMFPMQNDGINIQPPASNQYMMAPRNPHQQAM